jgi:hypothetical protein
MDLNNQFDMSNNIMMDNGLYASWQPEAIVNIKIQKDAKLTSNWKYRQYLQNNAQDIMKYNTMETIQASGNNPHTTQNTIKSRNVPYLFNSVHDVSSPAIGNNNSDLKTSYMKREQMSSRLVAPSISTSKF